MRDIIAKLVNHPVPTFNRPHRSRKRDRSSDVLTRGYLEFPCARLDSGGFIPPNSPTCYSRLPEIHRSTETLQNSIEVLELARVRDSKAWDGLYSALCSLQLLYAHHCAAVF